MAWSLVSRNFFLNFCFCIYSFIFFFHRQCKLSFNKNSSDKIILISLDNSSEKLQEKLKLVDSNTISQQALFASITITKTKIL